jgi:hypothetical protein
MVKKEPKQLTLQQQREANKRRLRHIYFLQQLKDIEDITIKMEHVFHPKRKWRIDYAIFGRRKIAIEINGGTWVSGRHNRPSSTLKEYEKLNELARHGYAVLQFTYENINDEESINIIKDILCQS